MIASAGRAPASVHPGAVYLHQGETYLVDSLDLEGGLAFVHAEDPGYTTFARERTDIEVTGPGERITLGPVTVGLVPVSVTNTVIGYLRRRMSGEVIDFVELDLPPRSLDTMAVMCTVTPEALDDNGIDARRIPGALHAAEHAAIGLLPLFAICDRWDVGGLSTATHPDTGRPTVFVHDGHPGGAGFAERGHAVIADWLTATRRAIAECSCRAGCPSCVQSPKCGNGNAPLDKEGAAAVLDGVLAAIREHPIAGPLLDPSTGRPEVTAAWIDTNTGTWLRARYDWLRDQTHGRPIIVDYKTTDSADPSGIRRSIYRYGYYQQDPWYLDGLAALGVDDAAFLFVFQEKTPPYLVTVVELDDYDRAAGRDRNRRAIDIYAHCTATGEWPGYATDVIPISLPTWAHHEEQ